VDVDVFDRLQDDRLGFRKGLGHGGAAGGAEGEVGAVDRMRLAIGQRHRHVALRTAVAAG